ncbi:hypothetical protein AAVH_23897 [Aphelenchoides avenae]|nr:hypothetical protein AAVH_23897 [Aphelenchus avenae]
MKTLVLIGLLFSVIVALALSDYSEFDDGDRAADNGVVAAIGRAVRYKRWVCNRYTGDFLCAGWPGAWRCTCGAACYNNVCRCTRCG